MSNTPLDRLMSDPTRCKIVVPDQIEIHWFDPASKIGDRCYCGKRVKKD